MPSRKNVTFDASGRKRIVQFKQDIGGAPDGQGGHAENWTTVSGLGNVPLSFLTWSPYQQFIAQQQYPGCNSRCTMRYRKSVAVTEKMQIVSGNHTYKIRGVANYDENDTVILLYLEELQATGSVR